MPNLHRMFKANEAIVVHAAATPYRERSHFDGQDVLESGVEKPGATHTGWLNRLLVGLAPEDRVGSNGGRAFAVGPVTPLVVRGPAPVLAWSPRRVLPASDDTIMRLLDLYRHTDVNFAEAIGTAAKFLVQPDGPRVGALAVDGWDTHYNEGIAAGWLAQLLAALDGALAAVQDNMGPAWRETVVVLVTEFGRTARINGTNGTDHGTATVVLLAGGALKGGR